MTTIRHALVAIAGVTLLTALSVHAQTSGSITVFLSWEAQTYVPPRYQGRALPVRGSKVAVSALLLDSGAPIDLSQREVRWFMNDALYVKGIGRDTFVFEVPFSAGDTLAIRADVVGYKGGTVTGEREVVLGTPGVVLDAGGRTAFAPGIQKLRALPYFFNAATLDNVQFDWSVNGAAGAGGLGADELMLTIPEDIPSLTAKVSAASGAGKPEFASDSSTFSIQ